MQTEGAKSGKFARIIYGGSLEVRLEVALAAEGLFAALTLELVRVHVEVVCKVKKSLWNIHGKLTFTT